jgi:hypothetical protein
MRVGLANLSPQEQLVVRILLSPYEVEVSQDPTHADYEILGGPSVESRKNGTTETEGGERILLDPGLLGPSVEIVGKTFNPRISKIYKLSTTVPISYRNAPKWLRAALLGRVKNESNGSDINALEEHARLELAREGLVNQLRNSGLVLREKRNPALVITHDIDTEEGFRKAVAMKSVEEEVGLKSIWFIPSDEYHFDQQTVRDLSENSVIGSHGTKHDGKLVHMKDRGRMVRRLQASKARLGRVFDREISCFRAPLLQFNESILRGVREAGYAFDFSLPSWEPSHPSVMAGFGIEYFHGFLLDGLSEVPLTMLQDHQALYVLGLSVRETATLWMKMSQFVFSYGGDVVLLIHPDYAFSDELAEYKNFLTALKQSLPPNASEVPLMRVDN